jgi:hypothetical protein
MRYFTPERWLRLQDTSDKIAWSVALADWEGAVREYAEVMKHVATRAPDLRPFLDAESLHDGIVLAYGRQDTPGATERRGGSAQQGSSAQKDHFFLLVRPDWPGDPLLVLLTYQLVAAPMVIAPVLPPEWRDEQAEWMYDEVGLEDNSAVLTHDILLNNGIELFLRFQGFNFTVLSVDVASLAPQLAESGR